MKNNKSIVLDTTYVLPLFGIEIKLIPEFIEKLDQIWSKGLKNYKIYLPSICLIEVMYKLLSEYRKKPDLKIINRYQLILPTVLNSPIKIFNTELSQKGSLIAIKIRHAGHNDVLDCWIAASAAALNAILLTEDKDLKNILKTVPDTKNLQVWTWKDLIREMFPK